MKKVSTTKASFAGWAALIAVGATGCQMNTDVMLGKRGSGHPSSEYSSGPYYYSSCPSGRSWRAQVAAVSHGIADCALPVGSLVGAAGGNDGSLRVSLRKMADGGFPSVAVLTYHNMGGQSASGYGHKIQFICFAGATSSDGTSQEFICRSTAPARVGAVSLSSRDSQLILSEITLVNPKCGAAESYTADWPDSSCPRDSAGTAVESIVFPDFYMESTN